MLTDWKDVVVDLIKLCVTDLSCHSQGTYSTFPKTISSFPHLEHQFHWAKLDWEKTEYDKLELESSMSFLLASLLLDSLDIEDETVKTSIQGKV